MARVCVCVCPLFCIRLLQLICITHPRESSAAFRLRVGCVCVCVGRCWRHRVPSMSFKISAFAVDVDLLLISRLVDSVLEAAVSMSSWLLVIEILWMVPK